MLEKKYLARIGRSSEIKIEWYINGVSRRHPLLGREKVYGAMDGLKLCLQQPVDGVIQNTYYNGWMYNH